MKISKNCYVIYGLTTIPPWMVNAGFIIGQEKTLVVDSGGNYLSAQTIYGYAKNVKPDNEIIVVNTEPHFDHIGGNCFFKEKGIDIYGHTDINRTSKELEETKQVYSKSIVDEVRRMEKEEDLVFYKTELVNPNKKITSDLIIDLGGLEVEIILTPGHTKMNLSVFVDNDRTLYCGDLIISGYIPNLDDGDNDDWKTWLLSIDKINTKSPSIIVPGHGATIREDEITPEIKRMRTYISKAIVEGRTSLN